MKYGFIFVIFFFFFPLFFSSLWLSGREKLQCPSLPSLVAFLFIIFSLLKVWKCLGTFSEGRVGGGGCRASRTTLTAASAPPPPQSLCCDPRACRAPLSLRPPHSSSCLWLALELGVLPLFAFPFGSCLLWRLGAEEGGESVRSFLLFPDGTRIPWAAARRRALQCSPEAIALSLHPTTTWAPRDPSLYGLGRGGLCPLFLWEVGGPA